MDEELYDPECSACERAQKDYAELERVTDDLAALVRRLAHSLKKAAPANDMHEKALDYLKRNGLEGSPLRTGHNAKGKPTAGLGAGYCPHGCKKKGDCRSPGEWCQHTPAECYPVEWGPSDNRRLTCACGNPDPAHKDKVPNAE